MDEFAQSRYRLEARYHHVLVDEFQDTSRAQWKLIARLIEAWGEGSGLSHDAPLQPSIFIVGDRKQSIYGFRDADVRLLGRARRHVAALRPAGRVRRSISRSFRSSAGLLAFTNDLFAAIEVADGRPDAFRYGESDRFPVDARNTEPEAAAGPRAGGERRGRRLSSRPRSNACCAKRRSATGRRGCRGRRVRATSRSSSARGRATASSRRPSRREGSRHTSTRAWASSTPTR